MNVTQPLVRIATALATLILAAPPALAHQEELPTPFKYVGGTENVITGCQGQLELTSEAMTFRCPSSSVSIPFSSLRHMEYRKDLSRKVRRSKLKWKVRPTIVRPIFGGNRNRYFTVLFEAENSTRAMVLDVQPEAMRPYLAEIDLKTGKRVDVEWQDNY
jgi:hypothetical protein